MSSGSDARIASARGSYLGATAADLGGRSRGERIWATLDPRALFPRHGMLVLSANRLVLTGWDDGAEVTVHASEIAAISSAADSARDLPLVGNLRRPVAAPVVVRHNNGGMLCLLINHRRFPARNDNVFWSALLTDWLLAKGSA